MHNTTVQFEGIREKGADGNIWTSGEVTEACRYWHDEEFCVLFIKCL
jgi:hypothetical protein